MVYVLWFVILDHRCSMDLGSYTLNVERRKNLVFLGWSVIVSAAKALNRPRIFAQIERHFPCPSTIWCLGFGVVRFRV
jgi:hypothetical protein